MKGVYEDNLSWIAGVKVETKKRKKDMKITRFANKQQLFLSNGARKLVGYFNDCESKSASA